MTAGDGPIEVNYIGYEEAIEAINKQTEERNAKARASNEEFYKKLKEYNESQKTKSSSTTSKPIIPNSPIPSTTKYIIATSKTTQNTKPDSINNFISTYFMVAIIVGIIILFYNKNKTPIKPKPQITPQPLNKEYKRKSCLTPTEQFFYRHLRKLVKEEYKIDPQVVIASIIETNGCSNWNKINKKTVDFVIRDENLNAILAIELDDKSHNRYDRIQRDNFVNQVFRDAGIPLIHIKTSNSYEKEINKELPNYLLKE